jgi:hypothetical protein
MSVDNFTALGIVLTLLALYVWDGFKPSSHVTGFQFFSLYTFSCALILTIDANEDVTTTLFTDGAWALIAFRIPVVPLIAGSKKSLTGSFTRKWNGLAA